MSRVVPTKLSNYSAAPVGVSNKNLEISYASILPSNSTSATTYTPSGTKRILFKIPSYANTFMDTSRSTISFQYKSLKGASDTAGNGCILDPRLGTTCIFERMTVKTSEGLVIEDISNLDTLNKVLLSMSSASETRQAEGIFDGNNFMSYELATAQLSPLLARQKEGVTYQYKFKTGVFSQNLKSFLPLHSGNGGGAGVFLSVELYLNKAIHVLQKVGTGSTDPDYEISDVRFNMCLLKADQSIVSRVQNLGNEIVIPITTYRVYTNSISAKQSTLQIAESCADLRRTHTVILNDDDDSVPTTTGSSSRKFRGGFSDTVRSVRSYQLQVGSKFIFNEALTCNTDNNMLMQQVIHAAFDNNIRAARLKEDTAVPQFEDEFFTLTTTFCYDDPDKYTNGISLGSQPLILKLELDKTPQADDQVFTFSELGYDMVFNDGRISLRDRKDITDYGY